MSLPQDSDSPVEELRLVHLQCCVWQFCSTVVSKEIVVFN